MRLNGSTLGATAIRDPGTMSLIQPSQLRLRVERFAPWLLTSDGFRVVSDDYDQRSFGNTVVVMGSNQILVRFVLDRSLLSVELAALSHPEEWWSLDALLRILGIEPLPPAVKIAEIGECIHQHLEILSSALGPQFPQTSEALEQHFRVRPQPSLLRPERPTAFQRILAGRFGRVVVRFFGWLVVGAAVWLACRSR